MCWRLNFRFGKNVGAPAGSLEPPALSQLGDLKYLRVRGGPLGLDSGPLDLTVSAAWPRHDWLLLLLVLLGGQPLPLQPEKDAWPGALKREDLG